MEAIIYQSNTGFTKRYAEMLSEATGIPYLSKEEADFRLDRGDEIIYMGWLMGGKISGFWETAARYFVKAVIAVGVSSPGDTLMAKLKKDNEIEDFTTLFYLQGGVDHTKLKGVKKIMLSGAVKSLEKAMRKGTQLDPKDREMFEVMKNGGDFVKKENLTEILEWFERNQEKGKMKWKHCARSKEAESE